MAGIFAITASLAAAAFFGRAGYIALRRATGGRIGGSSAFYKGPFESKMSRKEAALILQVPDRAASDLVRKRHRQLMLLNHPDRGGSPFLATKINEAKDLMDK